MMRRCRFRSSEAHPGRAGSPGKMSDTPRSGPEKRHLSKIERYGEIFSARAFRMAADRHRQSGRVSDLPLAGSLVPEAALSARHALDDFRGELRALDFPRALDLTGQIVSDHTGFDGLLQGYPDFFSRLQPTDVVEQHGSRQNQ